MKTDMKMDCQTVIERDTAKKSGRTPFVVFPSIKDTPPKVAPIKKSPKLPHGFGCMKDEIRVSDDFGAPIADFAAYMA